MLISLWEKIYKLLEIERELKKRKKKLITKILVTIHGGTASFLVWFDFDQNNFIKIIIIFHFVHLGELESSKSNTWGIYMYILLLLLEI